MYPALSPYFQDIPLTGDTRGNMIAVLRHHGCEQTIAHSLQVAGEARRLAQRFGAQPEQAEIAGWLHDISAIVHSAERLVLAERLQLEILPEERLAPMLVHQKLSAAIAGQVFGIHQPEVLSAIRCHTTLKPRAGLLDTVLFVADKIQWDQPGDPPYLPQLLRGLDRSLDRAALSYLEYLYQRRAQLPALHPWALEAYQELGGVL